VKGFFHSDWLGASTVASSIGPQLREGEARKSGNPLFYYVSYGQIRCSSTNTCLLGTQQIHFPLFIKRQQLVLILVFFKREAPLTAPSSVSDCHGSCIRGGVVPILLLCQTQGPSQVSKSHPVLVLASSTRSACPSSVQGQDASVVTILTHLLPYLLHRSVDPVEGGDCQLEQHPPQCCKYLDPTPVGPPCHPPPPATFDRGQLRPLFLGPITDMFIYLSGGSNLLRYKWFLSMPMRILMVLSHEMFICFLKTTFLLILIVLRFF
jgi:hypothetical protein